MKEKNYKNALEELNQEYKRILESREYRLGKKILKIKYYLKKGKIITLLKKLYNNRKMSIVYRYDKAANKQIFKKNDTQILGEFDKNVKVAIYTVNIGGYDNLIQPLFKNENVDFFIVSDRKIDNLGVWNWIDASKYIKDKNLTNVKKARFIKTHPHLIFKDYKYSIFIDGNIRCISDITDFIKKINKTTKIAIHPHPYRDCVYKEAEACRITGKGNYNVIREQLENYRSEGMPELFGLFETNVLIREHNDIKCINLMEQWWNEIKQKSERDQISFTYVLWKNGYTANDIGIICDSIKNNNYVQVVDHLEEYEKEEIK